MQLKYGSILLIWQTKDGDSQHRLSGNYFKTLIQFITINKSVTLTEYK